MSNDKNTMEDVRNLIVCDTQFGWTGSTTLRLQQMLALQERGWLAEGAENNEFDLTDAGREVVARALQSAVQPTLADVQPGGRVRLGDQVERARFEAWAHAQSYRGGNIMADRDAVHPDVYADPIAQLTWKSWQAALSAQPSPGGQDGPAYEGHTWVSDYVLAGLRERAAMPLQLRNGEIWHWQGDGHDFPESLVCPVIMSAETLRALLAARQPVGEIDEAAVLRRAAAVLYMWEDDPNLTGYMGDFNDACGILELLAQHAAPPAQAVDLDELRRAVCVVNVVGQIDGHDVVCRNSVLDVIDTRRQRLTDSKAVGNG